MFSSRANVSKQLFAVLIVATMLSTSAQSAVFNGVSLKISSEVVPAGEIFQFKAWITEPKPIVRGRISTVVSGTLMGASLNDPSGTTSGVATQNGNRVQVTLTSPQSTFGTAVDYPVLTLALRTSASLQAGQTMPLSLDPNLSLLIDPSGNPYPQEVKQGKLQIGGTLSVGNVVPGGGEVPAGGTVSIIGTGFSDPSLKVVVNEVKVASTRVVSPTRVDVTLSAPAVMDGTRIRVQTSRASVTYYSYLRALKLGQSARPLIAASEPIFSRQRFVVGTLSVQDSSTTFTGLSVQNPTATSVWIRVSLLNESGLILSSFVGAMPPTSKFSRDLFELFPGAVNGNTVQITTSVPIQMLGLFGDESIGSVVPVSIGVR